MPTSFSVPSPQGMEMTASKRGVTEEKKTEEKDRVSTDSSLKAEAKALLCVFGVIGGCPTGDCSLPLTLLARF